MAKNYGLTKMELNKTVEDHEKRINILEDALKKFMRTPQNLDAPRNFTFSSKDKNHAELLEELLKSDYCHSNNGLSFEEILGVFAVNKRPINPKKIRDLLGIWKKRKKIDATKTSGSLRYFWIEHG